MFRKSLGGGLADADEAGTDRHRLAMDLSMFLRAPESKSKQTETQKRQERTSEVWPCNMGICVFRY